jgi:hypothetical protein
MKLRRGWFEDKLRCHKISDLALRWLPHVHAHVERHDASVDRADVGILFLVLQTGLGQMQPARRSVGDEQIRPISEARPDSVLQKPVGDVDGRPVEIRLGCDRLPDGLTSVENHLQVERADDGTGRADMIPRGSRLLAPVAERLVYVPESIKDGLAPPIERCCRCHREDCIAFELGDLESRLHAHDDRFEQLSQGGIPGWNSCAEVDSMGLFDAAHESGIASDVSEQEVPIAGRRG